MIFPLRVGKNGAKFHIPAGGPPKTLSVTLRSHWSDRELIYLSSFLCYNFTIIMYHDSYVQTGGISG